MDSNSGGVLNMDRPIEDTMDERLLNEKEEEDPQKNETLEYGTMEKDDPVNGDGDEIQSNIEPLTNELLEPYHVSEEEETINFKCLICLDPAQNNRLIESTDLASTFVTLATKSRSKHFSSLPRKSFTDGLTGGWFCNHCFNRLHELNFLHSKIKTLQENLNKLELEIENEIITTYCSKGECPDENEAKKVTDLRRRFYKVSLKAIPVKIEPDVSAEELEADSITHTPTQQLPPTSEVEDDDEDEELWTPNPSEINSVLESSVKNNSGTRPRTRNFVKNSIKLKVETESRDEASEEDSCSKTPNPNPSSRNSRKRRRKNIENEGKAEESSDQKRSSKHIKKRRITSKNSNFTCTISGCEKSFTRESHRFVHIKKVHEGQDRPYACEECDKTFATPSKLRVHKRSHTGEMPFTCEFCGKSFMASWYLKQHMRAHTGNFICTICGKRAVSQNNLQQHMNTHSTVKPFVCEICGDAFATKQYLRFHQANKHEGTTDREPCQCSVCGKRFSSNTALRNHRVSAHQIGEAKYHCEVCNSAWNNQRELRIHYNVVHLNERKYECDICHKKCSTQNNVRVHKERRHKAKEDRPRPFKCNVCERAFYIKKTLQNHMALHTGDRPYACTQCDKKFPSMSYLNLHVYTIHDKRQRKTPAPPPNEKGSTTGKARSKSKKKTLAKPEPEPIFEMETPSPLPQAVEVITLTVNEDTPISVQLPPPYTTFYYHQYPPESVSFQMI